MKYDVDEFFRLVDDVRDQGGTWLSDERHDHVFFPSFSGPKKPDGQLINGDLKYCGDYGLFDIPYLDQDKSVSPTPESIKVCAVDDCIGLWPRFAKANAPGRDHLYMKKPE